MSVNHSAVALDGVVDVVIDDLVSFLVKLLVHFRPLIPRQANLAVFGAKPSFSSISGRLYGCKLALGPTVAMGSRLQTAIGEDHMRELMGRSRAGDLVKIREAALYVAQGAGGLITPSSAVSFQTSRELLLLAIEAFDDGSHATDALFSRWAGV